jgi:DNA mismatch endonuclease (patch repair protein)
MARDSDTDQRLQNEGWIVIRVWAHEEMTGAAVRIAQAIEHRRERTNRK